MNRNPETSESSNRNIPFFSRLRDRFRAILGYQPTQVEIPNDEKNLVQTEQPLTRDSLINRLNTSTSPLDRILGYYSLIRIDSKIQQASDWSFNRKPISQQLTEIRPDLNNVEQKLRTLKDLLTNLGIESSIKNTFLNAVAREIQDAYDDKSDLDLNAEFYNLNQYLQAIYDGVKSDSIRTHGLLPSLESPKRTGYYSDYTFGLYKTNRFTSYTPTQSSSPLPPLVRHFVSAVEKPHDGLDNESRFTHSDKKGTSTTFTSTTIDNLWIASVFDTNARYLVTASKANIIKNWKAPVRVTTLDMHTRQIGPD